jgi:ABC-type antimicrobial peptide transport system permease subunit
MILGQGFSLIAIGLVLGVPGAIVISRILQGLLYRVSPEDPTALMLTACTLALVGLLASLVPAVRATRADPLQMMRTE